MVIDEQLPQAISSLGEVTTAYDAMFCDVWGVLHNGARKFGDAEAALRMARGAGTQVVLVTNSPRSASTVAEFMTSIDISTDAYDWIVTSGDVTRALIEVASPKVFHIGCEAHRELFNGMAVERVGEDEAETIVVTGLYNDETETPEEYVELLRRLVDRKLPLICANPDIIAPRGDKVVWCAGALARDYAALGGSVQQAGKPFAPIYDLAVKKIGGMDGKRVLAIGDGLNTDIKGANDYRLDVLLVQQGVHADVLGDSPASLAAALRKEALTARYVIPTLR